MRKSVYTRRRTYRLGNRVRSSFRPYAKMRYNEQFRLAPGLGLATQLFRANSIFDPDLTGIGHQPYKHDTYAGIYNHYVVLGSMITVEVVTVAGEGYAPGGPFTIMVRLKDDGGATTDPMSAFIERGEGTYAMSSAQSNKFKLRSRYSAKKFFNITNVKDNLDRLGAAFGANPTEGAYYEIRCAGWSGADPGFVYVNVTIDYIVSMSEPIDLAQS